MQKRNYNAKFPAFAIVIALPLGGGSPMAAQKGSKSLEKGLQGREDIIFVCDLESDERSKDWELRAPGRNTVIVRADSDRKFEPFKGKALRVAVPKGSHYGTSFSFNFKRQIGSEPEEIYFRYYLRFADDWNPSRGGKLPGVSGTYGRAGWGGRPCNGRNGWSACGQFADARRRRPLSVSTVTTPT